ncbi:hypothetical protein ACIOYV_10885 [Pseudomonas sp. NPDC087342]|uniref:AMP-binding enzyme n=1 Tax=Pseudomonas sp. NPDC087342 TaxID=3364437 RepID=UPI003818B67D
MNKLKAVPVSALVLFLTDRRSFMIISGGVNIYPQEIENLLVTHSDVEDVAVIGAPDEEMGERVVAVVQPRLGVESGPGLAEALRSLCAKAWAASNARSSLIFAQHSRVNRPGS